MVESSIGEHKKLAKTESKSFTLCPIVVILFTIARPILVAAQRQIIGIAVVGFNTYSDELKDGSNNI
jgi:hypothetical protein